MSGKTVLSSGVRILTEEVPKSHVVSLGFWLNSGSRDEERSLEGITHLLEHMLFKGTSNRTTREIAKQLDALGGYTNAFTTKESMCLYGKVLKKHLQKLVDVLLDILVNSLFDSEELEREKQVIIQEINMVEDSPEDYVHTLFCEKFWPRHPLGHPICGYRNTVLSIGRSDLLAFRDSIIHPNQLIISAAGNISHESFMEIIAPSLENLRANGKGRGERKAPERKIFRELIFKKLEQVHICIGGPGLSLRDDRRFALYLLNVILGNSMSSRLFQEVREKRGLAYSIYSFLNSYEDTGFVGVYAAVEPSKVEELVRVVKGEISNLLEKGVREEELERAKDYVIGSIYLNMDGADAYMNRLAKNEIIHGKDITPEETEARFLGVSMGDIDEILKVFSNFEDLSLILLGPVNNSNFEKTCELLQ